MISRLRTSVILPKDSAWNRVELKLLVDDQDVVGSVFAEGPWADPDALLGPDSPLLPGAEPREVMLAEAECTWGCCGAIFVRIRRDGGDVVWDEWRNPDDPGLPLTAVRFDAAQYEAELARAHGTRFWEWPARTVARELRTRLREESDVLGRWNSGFHGATSLPGTREQIHLTFFSPPWDLIEDHRRRTGEVPDHTQFLARLPVTSEPAEVQAERIVAGLRAGDPRASAEVCGGHTARR
ncbi:hypothetical protein AB0F15_39390 [Amycolatopsis sp. NPDC026612]|uniref:hypothetical protein n=1 Tax=Amycolatopsis sp. NPDC026612 TaxID=3155466 RepID=UPI0033E3AE30